MKFFSLVLIALLAATMLPAQTSAPKKTTTHATPAAKSPVDNVIELVKSGMSENLIIKSLKRTNKPIDLSTADMVKLREAGVSDNIIGVMLDPTSESDSSGLGCATTHSDFGGASIGARTGGTTSSSTGTNARGLCTCSRAQRPAHAGREEACDRG